MKALWVHLNNTIEKEWVGRPILSSWSRCTENRKLIEIPPILKTQEAYTVPSNQLAISTTTFDQIDLGARK